MMAIIVPLTINKILLHVMVIIYKFLQAWKQHTVVPGLRSGTGKFIFGTHGFT